MSRPKIVVSIIASVMLALTAFTPIQTAQSQALPSTGTAKMDFEALQERKFCGKISVLDNLISQHGHQQLWLKSEEAGSPSEYRLLMYYDPMGKRFTIVKTYAKKNQACIIMTGVNVKLEDGVNEQAGEKKE